MGEINPRPSGCSARIMFSKTTAIVFKRIYTGENWNPDLQAPLAAPGVDVHEGEFLLSVNGREVILR